VRLAGRYMSRNRQSSLIRAVPTHSAGSRKQGNLQTEAKKKKKKRRRRRRRREDEGRHKVDAWTCAGRMNRLRKGVRRRPWYHHHLVAWMQPCASQRAPCAYSAATRRMGWTSRSSVQASLWRVAQGSSEAINSEQLGCRCDGDEWCGEEHIREHMRTDEAARRGRPADRPARTGLKPKL